MFPRWHAVLLRNAMVTPNSKIRGANMGPIWGQRDPGGPRVGPMNFAIWDPFGAEIKRV